MRKLLMVLGAITLTTATSSVIVSCGTKINQQQGNWTPTFNGWYYDSDFNFDELVNYIKYTEHLGSDYSESDTNNTEIGINQNLIQNAKMVNIVTMYKLIVANFDGLLNSLTPTSEEDKAIDNANVTVDLNSDQKEIFKNLFVGLGQNEDNISSKLNTSFKKHFSTNEKPWKEWESFEDFKQEEKMKIDISLKGTTYNGETPLHNTAALHIIKLIKGSLEKNKDNTKTANEIAKDIWIAFDGIDGLIDIRLNIYKEVSLETKEETNSQTTKKGLGISFNTIINK